MMISSLRALDKIFLTPIDLARMVRKLKHHEQKLLRKTDFISYKQDNDHRDKAVIRRYMIQKPEDYHKYNRLCGVRP